MYFEPIENWTGERTSSIVLENAREANLICSILHQLYNDITETYNISELEVKDVADQIREHYGFGALVALSITPR
jgi:hypothetical protein